MTDSTLKNLPGIKEDELIKLGNCKICGMKLLAGKTPLFYRVRVERAGLDSSAISRRAGLEMMLGSSALAHHMGPHEDLAKIIDGPNTVVIHEECAGRVSHLFQLFEDKGS